MTSTEPWIRFASDLPACCAQSPFRLPRPTGAHLSVSGTFGVDTGWEVGLDHWFARVGVRWADDGDALVDAVAAHLGREPGSFAEAAVVVAEHGVHLDDNVEAWVGEQHLVVASIGSDSNESSGREVIWDGRDLWEAADAEAGDLEELVAPCFSSTDEAPFGVEVADAWPGAVTTDAVILLRAVNITPVLRGYHLGAWAAAQSLALFDHGSCLVVTKAAPLSRRDAVPDLGEHAHEMSAAQSARWKAEQKRLASQWQTQLGMVPLNDHPTILTWHTSYRNPAVTETLRRWAW